jgi:hypothetical protein
VSLLVKDLYRNRQLARVVILHEVVNSEVQLAAIRDLQDRSHSHGKWIRAANSSQKSTMRHAANIGRLIGVLRTKRNIQATAAIK